MSSEEKIQWLDNLSGYLHQSSIVMDIIREILWGLVKLLKYLVDGCQTIYDEVFKILNFTSYAGLDKFFNKTEVKVVLVILVSLALISLGLTLLLNHGEKKPKVAQTMIIFFVVMTCLPALMETMNSFILNTKEFVQGDNIKMSDQVISMGITDVEFVCEEIGLVQPTILLEPSFDIETGQFKEPVQNLEPQEIKPYLYEFKNGLITKGSKNTFTGSNLENVTRIYPTDKVSGTGVLKYYLNGNKRLREIEEKEFFFIKYTPDYYCYNIDFISIYISLIAVGLVFIFTGFKIARIIWELAVHHFLAVIFSASDFTNGQKAKQVLRSIASSYIVIMLTCFLLKFFLLGQVYLSQTITNPLASCFMLVAFAVAVIDGPNIIQQILGIDAGISSGFKTFASIYMGSKAVAGVAKSTARSAKNILANTGVGIAGVAGGVAGVAEEARNEKKASVNQFSNLNASQNSVSNNIKNTESANASSGLFNTSNKEVDVGKNNVTSNAETSVEKGSIASAVMDQEKQTAGTEKTVANEALNQNSFNSDKSSFIGSVDKDSINGEKSNNQVSVSQGINEMLKGNSGINIPSDYKGNININNNNTKLSSHNNYADRLSTAFNKGREVGGKVAKGTKDLNKKFENKNK